MSPRFRPKRVGDQLRSVLAELIQRQVQDPAVGFVTVTEVRMSLDVQHATVFISVLGDTDDEERSMQALRRARAFLRMEAGKQMRLRQTPELHFKLDQTLANSRRIDELLADGAPEPLAEGGDDDDG